MRQRPVASPSDPDRPQDKTTGNILNVDMSRRNILKPYSSACRLLQLGAAARGAGTCRGGRDTTQRRPQLQRGSGGDFEVIMMAISPDSSGPNPTSEMSDSDYEKLVQNVHRSILASDGITTIDVLHNVRIEGKSGHHHQIDVYWKFKIGNVDY